jgi:hypothetical protein
MEGCGARGIYAIVDDPSSHGSRCATVLKEECEKNDCVIVGMIFGFVHCGFSF